MDNDKPVSVSYVGDLADAAPENILLVEGDQDYVRACQALATAGAAAGGLQVWVRLQNHYRWLQDFAGQIGCPCSFEEKTARLVLAERWNVHLPDWLTDADVQEQNLLGLAVDPTDRQTSFTNRCLSHLLGSALQADELTGANLVGVVTALVGEETQRAFERYPVLRRCLEAKCGAWAEGSQAKWVRNMCQHLPQHSGEVWHWLSVWACLHRYPERLLEFVLAPAQVMFVRQIPAETVASLPLEPKAREQALVQIELIFKSIGQQVTSSEDFQKAAGWTSGRLRQEYQFLAAILKAGQFSPTLADIQLVQARFESCPGVTTAELRALSQCVRPPRPVLLGPEQERTWQEWLQWTTGEYAPYRHWQTQNGHYDDALEQEVAHFSEWFVEDYAAIQQDPDLGLIHCLNSLSSSELADELSIVLLVDCLPLAFFDLIDAALRGVGFKRHDLHYRFAALPTATAYNKMALLRGNWQTDSGGYEAVLTTRAREDWGGRQVKYLSNLKALSEMAAPAGPAVVVLNLVDGDELLHSDVELKDTSYEEELHRLFARASAAASRLVQLWSGSRERISLYVVTDHGACRILNEEKRTLDSEVINKLFADEKHRFAAVGPEQAAQVPENLWALGYRFQRPFAPDDQVFFLPRGHNTVRQRGSARGYVHGGITPEEVIVPTSVYKLVRAAWKTPKTRFLHLDQEKETGRAKFYIQRLQRLEIEIQNPNPEDMRVLRANVAAPETDLKNWEVTTIPAGSASTFAMSCYFEKAALGKKTLEIELTYEIGGESQVLLLALECEFKSAVATGFSLRDL